jgi:hypothetical protein
VLIRGLGVGQKSPETVSLNQRYEEKSKIHHEISSFWRISKYENRKFVFEVLKFYIHFFSNFDKITLKDKKIYKKCFHENKIIL